MVQAAMGSGTESTPLWTSGETLPPLSTADAHHNSDLWRAAFGVEGAINDTWALRFDGIAGNNEVEHAIRDVVVDLYPLALRGLGGPSCDVLNGTPGAGDCQYYNPFLSSALPNAEALGIANSPDLMAWLVPLRTENYDMDVYSVDLLLRGELGELPVGPIGVAFGIGTRSEELRKTTDAISEAGGYATVEPGANWGGEQRVKSAYVEFALPVRDNLDIQIAARYEKYDSGFSETTPKIAALWRPRENLRLRASIGISFKGPSIQHLSGNIFARGAAPRSVVVDGATYGASGRGPLRFPVQTVGSSDVKPETSDNISLGFDWDIRDNISVGASWVSIEFDDQISVPNAVQLLSGLDCLRNIDGVLVDETDTPLTPGIGQDELVYFSGAEGGCVVPVDPTAPLTAANIGRVIAAPVHLAFVNTEQLDVRASFAWDTPVGPLTFSPSATIVLKYELPKGDVVGFDGTCSDGLVCDLVGRNPGRGFPGRGVPRWRMVANTQLNVGNHGLRFTLRYTDALNPAIDDLSEDQRSTFQRADGLLTADLNWTWRFDRGTRFSATIRNLATTIPDNASGQFNRRRRVFTLQLQHAFDK